MMLIRLFVALRFPAIPGAVQHCEATLKTNILVIPFAQFCDFAKQRFPTLARSAHRFRGR